MAALSEDARLNLTTVELWNCRNAFEFVCPRYFSELEPTDDPAVRFCKVCQEQVYQCHTPLEFVTHGELGHCVAIPEGYHPMGAFCTATLGRPSRQQIQERDRRVAAIREWWLAILVDPPQFAQDALTELARVFGLRPPEPQPPKTPAT